MTHHDPPGIIAPHIPADAYRRAQTTGQPVVIVVPANNTNALPWPRIVTALAVAGAAALGGWGLVVALCALLDAAAHTATVIAGAAGPIGFGGITLRLARTKHL
ncbi:hypothetical protein J8N05_04390 [Streptomyces sp. BH-SS-21]|uniref:Uncharacterized protein n=1 Tax=Streptomyces liliiviolaceus TaxID=2823109 RepID=A0A941B4T6_9ACTN|nr:hypothetical protein [Streptomyces liliiviolaceus]MBQ0847466.1 hypothetical protein [Streptomyces liliiviolaceus]